MRAPLCIEETPMVSKKEILTATLLTSSALLFQSAPGQADRIQLAQAPAPQAANPHAGHAMPAATNPVSKSWTAGALFIDSVWVRATPGGAKVAAGFLTIKNNGKEMDRLVKFETPAAGRSEMHEMAINNGVMSMREIEALDIKPGELVILKPGGHHLMLMDLKNPIVMGTVVKGTLTFEKAGAVEVEFAVTPIGAASPDGKPAAAGHKH